MNVTSLITLDYENIANCKLGENKPKTNPIQSQYNANQTQYNAKTNPIKPNFKRDTLLLRREAFSKSQQSVLFE